MEFINKFLVVFLAINLFLILEQWRILSLAGVSPNLLLILFLLASFFQTGFLFMAFLGVAVFLVFAVFMPFWLLQAALIIFLVFAMKFGRGFLSGNVFLDFLITLFLGTAGFYFLLKIFSAGSFESIIVLKEIVYNLILGAAGWFLLRLFQKKQFLK